LPEELDLGALFSSFDTIVLVPFTVIALAAAGLVSGGVVSVPLFCAIALRLPRPA
jgi:hypothetical protein